MQNISINLEAPKNQQISEPKKVENRNEISLVAKGSLNSPFKNITNYLNKKK
jgi:hypothetical protein